MEEMVYEISKKEMLNSVTKIQWNIPEIRNLWIGENFEGQCNTNLAEDLKEIYSTRVSDILD